MKKLIVGLAAVGAVLALRPVVKRRMVQKMGEHCEQMAAHCKDMMAANDSATENREPPEQEAPQFESQGEAVAV